jgi:hypothetical protein
MTPAGLLELLSGLHFTFSISSILILCIDRKSINGVLIKGLSPIMYACTMFDDDLAIDLLQHGIGIELESRCIDNCYTALLLATETQQTEIVFSLLEAKADIHAKTADIRIPFGNAVQTGGRTALHLAAMKGNKDIILRLLEMKSDPSAVDFSGNTALFYACANGHHHIITYLQGQQDLSVLTESYITKKNRSDLLETKARFEASFLPYGPFLETHTVASLLSVDECTRVLEAVITAGAASGWTTSRHRNYATTDIPLSDLPDPLVSTWVRAAVQTRVFPAMTNAFGLKDSNYLSVRDMFFVKYSAQPGAQAELDLHRDGSFLSFNVLLNSETDFKGGGTVIPFLSRTFTIKRGDCFMHCGQLEHGGNKITEGERYLLVRNSYFCHCA